uniref:Uncharacterized protein n=1 Tax=viral metagenome TaxID=1070528 RepID=A0A6M3LXD1_9ZZZZ
MSRSGNAFIAQTQGAQFTLYAAMRAMGIPLTESQEKCQEYLEKKYGFKGVMLSEEKEQPKGG